MFDNTSLRLWSGVFWHVETYKWNKFKTLTKHVFTMYYCFHSGSRVSTWQDIEWLTYCTFIVVAHSRFMVGWVVDWCRVLLRVVFNRHNWTWSGRWIGYFVPLDLFVDNGIRRFKTLMYVYILLRYSFFENYKTNVWVMFSDFTIDTDWRLCFISVTVKKNLT